MGMVMTEIVILYSEDLPFDRYACCGLRLLVRSLRLHFSPKERREARRVSDGEERRAVQFKDLT